MLLTVGILTVAWKVFQLLIKARLWASSGVCRVIV